MENADALSDDSEKHTKEIDRLKMEKDRSKTEVEVLNKELAELREKLGKNANERAVGVVKWFQEKNG